MLAYARFLRRNIKNIILETHSACFDGFRCQTHRETNSNLCDYIEKKNVAFPHGLGTNVSREASSCVLIKRRR